LDIYLKIEVATLLIGLELWLLPWFERLIDWIAPYKEGNNGNI